MLYQKISEEGNVWLSLDNASIDIYRLH